MTMDREKLTQAFVKNVAKFMRKQKMTAKDLARESELDYSAVKKYVTGEREISFYSAVRIAGALDVTVDDLIWGF